MASLDVAKLLEPASPEAPSGPNLEYDPTFVEMERAAQGKPERQMGDNVIAAEEPDWRDVRRQAIELLGRTKDLRIGVVLVRAALRTDGFTGMADGLALLNGMVAGFWDTVHPQLDPEDGNDPLMRVNVLASLCDADSVLRPIREVPIVASRALGRYTLRDYQVATGAIPGPAKGDGAPAPTLAAIEAAMMDTEIEPLKEAAEAASHAAGEAKALDAGLTARVGVTRAADFAPLRDVLKSVADVLGTYLSRRGAATGAAEGEAGAAGGGAKAQALSGEITSREDVIRVLDKVVDFYRKNEPSSPVPILVKRAKRLATKSFMEIIKDVASDGLSQVERLRGADAED